MRLRCGCSRCDLVNQRPGKAVAPARHCRKRLRAEQLAQGRDLDRDVGLFDHDIRPDHFHQLFFADDAVGAFDQGDEQIEGARTQVRGLATDSDSPLAAEHFDIIEAVDRLHR